MIVFYTRYRVIDSFSSESLLKLGFDCVSGMRNVPEDFKNITWDHSDSGEWKSGRNYLAYEMDAIKGLVAFRVAIVDETDELWTTDAALNEEKHEIQLRLAREKRIISAEYSNSFHLPYLFKKIIREGISAADFDLPINDVPVYITEENLNIISEIITKKRIYSLPIIYVSHPFSKEEYDIDVNELARDMAGSAHVLVEQNSETSVLLKELTDSKNAYNGSIEIFFDDDSLRYYRWPEVTINQYRYKISHAVYSRMAMRNIDDEGSLSAIRINNKIKKLDKSGIETNRLYLKIEELEDKIKYEKELFELSAGEVKELQRRVSDLENDKYEMQIKMQALQDALDRKNNGSSKTVNFDTTENQFYDDEIKRIILESIRLTISSYGPEEQTRRDYHILKDLVDSNKFSKKGEEIKKEMLRIIRQNNLTGQDVRALKGLGFEVQQSGHDKYVFHNDDRYIITVSNSPSDYRDGENLAHEAVNLIFGRT